MKKISDFWQKMQFLTSDDLSFNMNENNSITSRRTPSGVSIDIFHLPLPCLRVELAWGRGNPIWRRLPSWILKNAQTCEVGNQANLHSFDPYNVFQSKNFIVTDTSRSPFRLLD